MHEGALVSIIIIFLNEEKFLSEAVESVLEQSFTDWELLLVDDGSRDKSTEMAKAYAQQYTEKIHYLEHPDHQNRGMSASRNLGIAHAKGKYISYLDGDDIWLPNKLSRQIELIKANPEAVMVYGPLLLWYSWTGKSIDKNRDHLYGLEALNIRVQGDRIIAPPALLSLFIQFSQLIPAGVLIEKQSILDAGGYEEVFKGHYEDAVLLAKVCLRSPVYVSNECWYQYRQHSASSTAQVERTGRGKATRIAFLNWLKQYFEEQGVTNPELWKALDKAYGQDHRSFRYRSLRLYFLCINKIEAILVRYGRKVLSEKNRQQLWKYWVYLKNKNK